MDQPNRPRRSTWIVGIIVVAIAIAHVFLWRSDMPTGEKLMWTILNGISWTIILAPVFFVDRWLDTIKAKNKAEKPETGRTEL